MVHFQTMNNISTFSLYFDTKTVYLYACVYPKHDYVANVKGQCPSTMLVPVGRPSTPSLADTESILD